ncbi:hypothetical protein [Chamaesiphon sp. VAR_48_metabat_403]|uniref:hypothetical protein n=1 Tax=Chamaesiphon sp. VAR_48_metabat_403 TaxID=2964700 RepID=UPI00286E57BC|nr:hypothetical protein [Chamaesiphon sp. VAR_48_metabat_403]
MLVIKRTNNRHPAIDLHPIALRIRTPHFCELADQTVDKLPSLYPNTGDGRWGVWGV